MGKYNKGMTEGMQAGGNCICLKCGHEESHPRGVPCREMRCPKCGIAMVREGSYHHELFLKKHNKKEG